MVAAARRQSGARACQPCAQGAHRPRCRAFRWCIDRRRRAAAISICIARCSACRSRSAPSLKRCRRTFRTVGRFPTVSRQVARARCRTTAACASEYAGPATARISTTATARSPLEQLRRRCCRFRASTSSACKKKSAKRRPRLLSEHGVLQLGQEFADFADTAAVVAMLDLVIAVDTSVAHLAGAMGKAVALLVPFSPDWRWLLDRTDSPWYPTHAAVPAVQDRRLERAVRAARGRNLPRSRARPAPAARYSTRLTASGWPCFGFGAAVRPEAP